MMARQVSSKMKGLTRKSLPSTMVYKEQHHRYTL